MKKTELQSQLEDLRVKYRAACELRAEEIMSELKERGLEIRRKIERTAWCAQCHNLERNETGFCSTTCQDLYYPPKRTLNFKNLITGIGKEVEKINANK